MAITTVQGIIDGLLPPVPKIKSTNMAQFNVTGWWQTDVYAGGVPAAMAAPSPGVAGAAVTSRTGLISFTNPPSGETRLAKIVTGAIGFSGVGSGASLIVDRLWDNSGLSVTSTSAQAVTSAAWPARDINGSTNGEGVYIGLEVSTILGTGVPTVTLDYTNSAGTAGRTGTLTIPSNASAVGMFYHFTLQAGDTGVRSIENFTLSATCTSGAFHLVAFRPLYMAIGNSTPIDIRRSHLVDDAISTVAPKLFDNTCLQQLVMCQGNTQRWGGICSFYVAQG